MHAVSSELKRLQRKALDSFQADNRYQPSGYSHGFTPKKSIITNAAYHRRSRLIIKVDLKDFFPSIHFGRVQGMFMAPPFHFGEEAATTMAQMSCLDNKKGKLPQGGVLSPYIANMLCRRLDKRLAELARENRCRFTRYADDITFSTNDVIKLKEKPFLKKVYNIIKSEHFSANKDKTKVLTSKDRQIVTGIVVNDGINVNRKYVRNLRATIHNCEKSGVERQLWKKEFKDERNSRIVVPADAVPTTEYFLKHLFGKVNFLGSVVLSAGQKEQHDDDSNKYRRIKTYEQILRRFYNLKEVQSNQEIRKLAKAAMVRRPSLKSLLSFKDQGTAKRKEVLAKYQDSSNVKAIFDRVNAVQTMSEVETLVEEKKKNDPRLFGISLGTDVVEAKKTIRQYLSYPPFDKEKTTCLLESLKLDGGLKHLVHTNDKNWSVKDCYRILLENYEGNFIYLPFDLRDEFEDWKKALDEIAAQCGEDFRVDVMDNSTLSKSTLKLKRNTRFGGTPDDSTNFKEKIDAIIEKVNPKEITLQIEGKLVKSLYTHVPSVLKAIHKIIQSMSNHSKEHGATTIKIESKKQVETVEIIIWDDSIKSTLDSLENRNFVHGKLSDVIRLTNGLCEYKVELTLKDGSRAGLDMHNECQVESNRKKGFVHRLIFPYIN